MGTRTSLICVISLAVAASGLSACNGKDDAQPQSVGNDWVRDPSSVIPTPGPTSPPVTPPPDQLYTGPVEVEKYVVKFVDDAKAQGVDVVPDMDNPKLEIRIASLDAYGSSTIGLCETGNGRRRVTFDPDFWNSVSDTQKEILSHHELGHCVLYRGHRSTTLSGGAYASVMYPIIMSSSTYNGNYDYYLNELFTYSATMGASSVDASADTTHICNH